VPAGVFDVHGERIDPVEHGMFRAHRPAGVLLVASSAADPRRARRRHHQRRPGRRGLRHPAIEHHDVFLARLVGRRRHLDHADGRILLEELRDRASLLAHDDNGQRLGALNPRDRLVVDGQRVGGGADFREQPRTASRGEGRDLTDQLAGRERDRLIEDDRGAARDGHPDLLRLRGVVRDLEVGLGGRGAARRDRPGVERGDRDVGCLLVDRMDDDRPVERAEMRAVGQEMHDVGAADPGPGRVDAARGRQALDRGLDERQIARGPLDQPVARRRQRDVVAAGRRGERPRLANRAIPARAAGARLGQHRPGRVDHDQHAAAGRARGARSRPGHRHRQRDGNQDRGGQRHGPAKSLPPGLVALLIEDAPPEQERRHVHARRPDPQQEQPRREARGARDQEPRLPAGHRAETHARNRPWRNVCRMICSNARSASSRM
jgi:hypothetical protein